MRINDLNEGQLRDTLATVEKELSSAPRKTKAIVIATLASLSLCSKSSTGTEKTLLKAAETKGIPSSVFPLFAELMGKAVSSRVDTQEIRETAAGAAPTVPTPPRTPGVIPFFSMLGAVSAVAVRGENGTAYMTDGEQRQIGGFDASDLRANFNLIEFNLS